MLAFALALTLSLPDLRVLSVPDTKSVWIEALHNCENPDNVPSIIDSNNKRSYGAYMFQMETWISYGKKLGATKENINDDELQEIVTRDMLDKGLWRHWYWCSKKVIKKLGAYPIDTK